MRTIKARIKFQRDHIPLVGEARCGRCDQLLTRFVSVGKERFRGFLSGQGWKIENGVWEPTTHHRKQRELAKRELANGLLTREHRRELRSRLARNEFSRPNRERDGAITITAAAERSMNDPGHDNPGDNHPDLFPLTVKCPDCPAINVIDLDNDKR
jgi:phage FluMu protein Com